MSALPAAGSTKRKLDEEEKEEEKLERSLEKRRKELPKELIHIKNDDKVFHEKWDSDRDPLNFPHPFRAALTGPPNVGKTTAVKNILLRADPPFERVVVIHADPENTREYADCGKNVKMCATIPSPHEWPGDVKTLVIIDDMEQRELKKAQRSALDRLIGYCSTHKNISCCTCTQVWSNQAPIVRKCCNVFVIWKSDDLRGLREIAKRVRVPDLVDLMDTLCPNPKDSFWVDQTGDTPFPFRRNGFVELEFEK